jgi:hypothetical protein
MQEDPSSVPEGETPRSLLMYAFDTNVDGCKPGDKVTMTGEQGDVGCGPGRAGCELEGAVSLTPQGRPPLQAQAPCFGPDAPAPPPSEHPPPPPPVAPSPPKRHLPRHAAARQPPSARGARAVQDIPGRRARGARRRGQDVRAAAQVSFGVQAGFRKGGARSAGVARSAQEPAPVCTLVSDSASSLARARPAPPPPQAARRGVVAAERVGPRRRRRRRPRGDAAGHAGGVRRRGGLQHHQGRAGREGAPLPGAFDFFPDTEAGGAGMGCLAGGRAKGAGRGEASTSPGTSWPTKERRFRVRLGLVFGYSQRRGRGVCGRGAARAAAGRRRRVRTPRLAAGGLAAPRLLANPPSKPPDPPPPENPRRRWPPTPSTWRSLCAAWRPRWGPRGAGRAF